ncbi:MAG: C_GCAxxG_C_C family protein [Deltaproteobacteria bacterium]|nr:MAG: C_GCAxxG_C_C family protein [Deltaproteobacteria bacterium]
MIGVLRRGRAQQAATGLEDCAERAGVLYDGGYNCAQAVLQAVTGRSDPELLAMAKAFGGGIGKSGCLCGAVTGGVMALGLSGRPELGGRLVEGFRGEFRSTCCRALSKDYRWLSREHKANCRKLTVAAAAMAAALLKE